MMACSLQHKGLPYKPKLEHNIATGPKVDPLRLMPSIPVENYTLTHDRWVYLVEKEMQNILKKIKSDCTA